MPLVAAGFAVRDVQIGGACLDLGWLGVPLTVGWIVAVMNAANFLDGADAVAAGTGACSCAWIAASCMNVGEFAAAAAAMGLAGSLLGFLCYNRPPATIYLGDGGSMALGAALAALSLRAAAADASRGFLAAVPLGLVAVPLADLALAVARRTLSGRCFWVADREHVHHRLLDRGLSSWSAAGILVSLAMVCGAASYAAVVTGHEAWVWGTGLVVIAAAVRMRLAGHVEWALLAARLRRRAPAVGDRLPHRDRRGAPVASSGRRVPGMAWPHETHERQKAA
jgi:UDP-GlcNAc:undecaprenyl-phosphate GlcNAc-1-phosphate transferase